MGAERDEIALRRRAMELAALARTELDLPLGGTITQLTLQQDREAAPAPTLMGPARASDLPCAADLPRITIDGRDVVPLAHGSPPTGRADYALVSTLGEGGMGRVHLARQRSLERDVALKTLKEDAEPAVAEALLREARITGSLEHPGVTPVHLLGVDARDRPLLVMKRIDGVDLGAMLADRAHPAWRASGRSEDPVAAALQILTQVCLTLEFAHSRGIIHRDIKPENVMVGSFGEVVLLDWGIATNAGTKEAALVGTPLYMAPEMVLGEVIDARTDVYLLGATLHEILMGRPRHEGVSVMEVMRAALLSPSVDYPASVPTELGALCNWATSPDPAARPQTAAAFRRALDDFAQHTSARALAQEAVTRLEALERALASAGEAPPHDLAEAYRLGTEARFGLVQSLREHPDDAGTRASMRRCVLALVELELRQGHAETAAALTKELDTPDVAVAARIASVQESNAQKERERARLEQRERELDPRHHARKRSVLLAGMSLTVPLALFAFSVTGTTPSPARAFAVTLAFFVAVLAVGVAVRRRVLTSTFNRRGVSVFIVGIGSLVIHRAVSLVIGDSLSSILASDLVIFSALLASASITLLRPLWLCAVVPLLGIAPVIMATERPLVAFAAAAFATVVSMVIVLSRARPA